MAGLLNFKTSQSPAIKGRILKSVEAVVQKTGPALASLTQVGELIQMVASGFLDASQEVRAKT